MLFPTLFKKKNISMAEGFDVKNEGVILRKTSLPFEADGVLNPACIEKDGFVHMFYRAVALGNRSSIGYARFDASDRLVFRADKPILSPEFDYESQGLEDPRIVCVDGTYYLFYVAYDGTNARTAYATSADLVTFKKQGIVSPQFSYKETLSLLDPKKVPEKFFEFGEEYQRTRGENVLVFAKDFFLFPRKINGKFALLHRLMPGIQIVTVDGLEDLQSADFWKDYFRTLPEHFILNPKYWFESFLIGNGAPAIETPYGWLSIYHAAEKGTMTYRACAALLDLADPRIVIGRLEEPLFSPSEKWERKGIVNNVVFPTSALVRGDRLHIYYGAADDCIAAKSVDMDKLLNSLLNKK